MPVGSDSSSGVSWGQWAKQSLSANRIYPVLSAANLGRAIDTLDRNQRRAEAIGDLVMPSKTEEESESKESDEMGVHLGDVVHPTPVIVQGGSGNLGQIIAAAALAALIPTAGLGVVGGYLATKSLTQPTKTEQPVVPGYEDQTVDIGLGRIEDYE